MMGRVPIRRAQLVRFEVEDRVRVAVVICPWCSSEHRHAVPVDLLPDAPILRRPRCSGTRPDYSICLDIVEDNHASPVSETGTKPTAGRHRA